MDFNISTKELSLAVKNLKNNKSAGLDCIKNEMVKYGYSVLSDSLVKLFNLVYSSGHFPTIWNTNLIKPIYKKGDKTNSNNYRGISISSCVGKLFCSILNERLVDITAGERNVYQIGFEKGERTSDHLYVLKCLVEKYLNIKIIGKCNKLFLCFIDL